MAVLSSNDRSTVHGRYMRELSAALEPFGLLKADLLAAVNAADDWVNSNALAFSQALPLPARGAMTAAQKARLILRVVEQRYLSGV